jgi:pimeloyl-ACP methyl ester carboxylesterase
MRRTGIDRRVVLALLLAGTACGPVVARTQTGRAENAPNESVTIGETTFAYRSFGAGPPVIFLNRFRATMDHWDPALLNVVATKHRVIVFDNAGVGLSTGRTPDTFTAMADDAARFTRALGIERADFVGWSIGGMVAQALLVRHPQLVRRAVLLATIPPGGTVEQFPPISDEVRQVVSRPGQGSDDDFLFLFFAPSESSRMAGRESLARLRARSGPPSPPVRPEAMRSQVAALTDWYRGANGILASFRRIDRPVLVANGRQDVMFSAQQSVALAREIPTAQLALYPDSGHAFMFQYPELFGRRLLDFLSEATERR